MSDLSSQKELLSVVQARHAQELMQSGIVQKALHNLGSLATMENFNESKPKVVVHRRRINTERERGYSILFAKSATQANQTLMRVLKTDTLDPKAVGSFFRMYRDLHAFAFVGHEVGQGYERIEAADPFTESEFALVRGLGHEILSLKEEKVLPALNLDFGCIGYAIQ
jgi:hypothetical protein